MLLLDGKSTHWYAEIYIIEYNGTPPSPSPSSTRVVGNLDTDKLECPDYYPCFELMFELGLLYLSVISKTHSVVMKEFPLRVATCWLY